MAEPKIALAGNCQVRALEAWFRGSLPSAEVLALAPYHLLRSEQEIQDWIKYAKTADKVFVIPVRRDYFDFPGLSLEDMSAQVGSRLYTYTIFTVKRSSRSGVMRKTQKELRWRGFQVLLVTITIFWQWPCVVILTAVW